MINTWYWYQNIWKLFYSKLTSGRKVILQMPMVATFPTKFTTMYGAQRFIFLFTPLFPILTYNNPVHNLPCHLWGIYFTIAEPPTLQSHVSSSHNIWWKFSHTCATVPVRIIFHDMTTLRKQNEDQLWSISSYQLIPTSVSLSLLGTNIPLCTPLSNTHGLHTIPQPHITTSKMYPTD